MYLMYVDESGDPGTVNSPAPFYILSAIVIHESNWTRFLNDAVTFRRYLKTTKGLLMREEIHASAFINGKAKLKNSIKRNDRLAILKSCINWLSSKNYLSIVTVKVDKTINPDPFLTAWRTLMQRFDNTLKAQNFPQPAFVTDLGIIIADNTDARKLTSLLRKMRKINFVPSMFQGLPARNLPLKFIIKDPVFRESAESYVIQFVDVIVYFARQHFIPNSYIKKKAGRLYYGKLQPIINQNCNRSPANFRIIQV